MGIADGTYCADAEAFRPRVHSSRRQGWRSIRTPKSLTWFHTKWSEATDVPFGWVQDLAQTERWETLGSDRSSAVFGSTACASRGYGSVVEDRDQAPACHRDGNMPLGGLPEVVASSRAFGKETSLPFRSKNSRRRTRSPRTRDGSSSRRDDLRRPGPISRDGHWREAARALHHSAKDFPYNVWFDPGRRAVAGNRRWPRLKLPPWRGPLLRSGVTCAADWQGMVRFAESEEGTVWFADRDSVRGDNPSRSKDGGAAYRDSPCAGPAGDLSGSEARIRALIRIPTRASTLAVRKSRHSPRQWNDSHPEEG